MKGSPGRDLGSAAHSPSFQPLEPSHSPSFPLLWLLTPPQGPGTWWEGQGRRGERRNLFRETRAPGETSHGLLHSQHPPNLVLAFKGMNDSSGAQHRTSASLCKLLDSHPNGRKGTVYGQRGHGSLQTAWEQNSSQTPPVFSTVSNQVLRLYPPTPPRIPGETGLTFPHSPFSLSCLSRCLVGSEEHKRVVSTGQETAAPNLGPKLNASPAHHQPKVHSSWPPNPPRKPQPQESLLQCYRGPQVGSEPPLPLCSTQ